MCAWSNFIVNFYCYLRMNIFYSLPPEIPYSMNHSIHYKGEKRRFTHITHPPISSILPVRSLKIKSVMSSTLVGFSWENQQHVTLFSPRVCGLGNIRKTLNFSLYLLSSCLSNRIRTGDCCILSEHIFST